MSQKRHKHDRKSSPPQTQRPAPLRPDAVDVVVPVFNRLQLVERAVRSAKAHGGPRLGKFIFVDDASTEPGLREFCEREGLYVRQVRNRGFAASANAGARRSVTPYFVLLNSDTEATPGWLEPLVAVLEARPEVAVAAPLLLFPPASRDPDRPAGKVQSCGFAVAVTGRPYHRLITWSPEHPRVQQPRDDLQGATGAVWCVRRSIWQALGGFEEAFGAYYEDADYCLRARAAGYKIAYVPRSILYHWVGASYTAAPAEGARPVDIQANERAFLARHRDDLVYDEWAVV